MVSLTESIQLLDKNPETRCGKNGLKDIKALGFFAEFDWKKLESSDSPLVPLNEKELELYATPLNNKELNTPAIPQSSSIHIRRYSFSNFSFG